MTFLLKSCYVTASDRYAGMQLRPEDYGKMSTLLRDCFGDGVVLGLEWGYSLDPEDGIPAAIAQTVAAFATPPASPLVP